MTYNLGKKTLYVGIFPTDKQGLFYSDPYMKISTNSKFTDGKETCRVSLKHNEDKGDFPQYIYHNKAGGSNYGAKIDSALGQQITDLLNSPSPNNSNITGYEFLLKTVVDASPGYFIDKNGHKITIDLDYMKNLCGDFAPDLTNIGNQNKRQSTLKI